MEGNKIGIKIINKIYGMLEVGKYKGKNKIEKGEGESWWGLQGAAAICGGGGTRKPSSGR